MMLGYPNQDIPAVEVGRKLEGAGYRREASRPTSLYPQNLRVSNKSSEHNILNMPIYYAKQVLPRQTFSAQSRKLFSSNIVLPS